MRALGQAESLTASLEGTPGLQTAFLAADLPLSAEMTADATPPVPLILIGGLPIEEIDAIQSRTAMLLGLPASKVEAVFYTPDDWQERVDQRSPYAVWLLDGPRTLLFGELD